jgi:hypothetical protein
MTQMKLKQLLLWTSILISLKSISQEINLGGNIGLIPMNDTRIISLGGSFEFRPIEAVISFNTDPFLVYNNKRLILTEPIYLKYIIQCRLVKESSGRLDFIGI